MVVRAESQGLYCHQAVLEMPHLEEEAAFCLVTRPPLWVGDVGPFDRPLQSKAGLLGVVFYRLIMGAVFGRPIAGMAFSHQAGLVFCHRLKGEVFCHRKAEGVFDPPLRLEAVSHRVEVVASYLFLPQAAGWTAAYQVFRATSGEFGWEID